MKLNSKKTKVMLFNPSSKIDFQPSVNLGDVPVECVDEFKLLGITLKSDLKWNTNTQNISSKAYKRLWTLRRLKANGASDSDLLEVYEKQVRPVLEFSVPVWHSGITKKESKDIERVQKCAIRIILQDRYQNYTQALNKTHLKRLSERS